LVSGSIATQQHVGGRRGAAQGEVDAAGRQRIDRERRIADGDPIVANRRFELVAGAGRHTDLAARLAAGELADVLGPRQRVGPAVHRRQARPHHFMRVGEQGDDAALVRQRRCVPPAVRRRFDERVPGGLGANREHTRRAHQPVELYAAGAERPRDPRCPARRIDDRCGQDRLVCLYAEPSIDSLDLADAHAPQHPHPGLLGGIDQHRVEARPVHVPAVAIRAQDERPVGRLRCAPGACRLV